MATRKQHEPTYLSPEFKASPAYADFTAALATVGCRDYAALLASPRHVRDRFHEDWSARMRERLPSVQQSPDTFAHYQAIRADTSLSLKERVRQLHAQGCTDSDIRAALDISRAYAAGIRRSLGLTANGPLARNAKIRPLIIEGAQNGMTDAQMAADLGVSAEVVGHIRRAAGVRRSGWGPLTPTQLEVRAKALALRKQGAEFSEIGRQLGISKATAFKWVRKERARAWWADRREQEAA